MLLQIMDYVELGNYLSCKINIYLHSSAADKHTLPTAVFEFHTVLAVQGMEDPAAMVGNISDCSLKFHGPTCWLLYNVQL